MEIKMDEQSFLTYYRVQGGKPPLASYKSVIIDENGKLQLDMQFAFAKGKRAKDVFFGDTEFMQSFLKKRCKGFFIEKQNDDWNVEVITHIIPRFIDDFIQKNSYAQKEKLTQKWPARVNHGPGIGLQFNNAWRDLFFSCGLKNKKENITSREKLKKFLVNTALKEDEFIDGKIDSKKFFSSLKKIISYKPTVFNDEELKLIGLNNLFGQIENNYSLFDIPKEKLDKEISDVRKQYNNSNEKSKQRIL